MLETNQNQKNPQVIRRFINSAIYVEKPLASPSISSENTSISHRYSSDDLSNFQNVKTKRCTCSTNQKSCPCHPNALILEAPQEVKKPVKKSSPPKIKLSHPPSIPPKIIPSKKIVEEKKKTVEPVVKIKDREALLEQERNNFKIWLANKKKTELELKKKKQKEMEDMQLKELEKQKRHLENQLNFQLWVKRKEEAQLEKKIKEQMHLITELEQKEKQVKDNDKAFQEWLKNARNRQKPVPMNKGLQSLCSSPSITYVNPNPWNPSA